MENVVPSPLAAWENFYVIVGSSGAALTGLQFVVIALIAESRARATARQIDAFGTPTIVHFCAVLFISAILSAPWQGLTNIARVLGICGLTGVVYGVIVIRRAQLQTGYRPVFEDWLFHTVLPLISYSSLTIAAILLPAHAVRALFVVAATALLLLSIGIHNAWDTVTYIALGITEPKDGALETESETQE
jgi:hypothetical protein